MPPRPAHAHSGAALSASEWARRRDSRSMRGSDGEDGCCSDVDLIFQCVRRMIFSFDFLCALSGRQKHDGLSGPSGRPGTARPLLGRAWVEGTANGLAWHGMMAPPGRAFNGSGPGWATVWPSMAVGAWSCLVPTPGPCTPCNWEPLRGLLGSMGDGVPVVGSAVLGDLGRVAAVGVAAPPTSMLELQQHLCVPLQTPLIPGRPKRRVAKIE